MPDQDLKKETVTIESERHRKFSYKKGSVNLSFVLRTDMVTELEDFLILLEKATGEVIQELTAIKNQNNA